MIELTHSSAARLDCLARLIAQRRANLRNTEQFLDDYRAVLSLERIEELEQHLADIRKSLHEMDADYRRIAQKPFN